MNTLEFSTEIIDSKESFQAIAEDWNQLWQRSGSHVAFHRSESIQYFLETFDLTNQFRAVLVRCQNQIVAAVPLIVEPRRLGGWQARSVANEWALQACFLDTSVGAPGRRMEALKEGFSRLGLTRVKLDWFPLDWSDSERLTTQWQARYAVWVKPRFEVHKMFVPADWPAYFKQVSKRTRSTINRAENQLQKSGKVEVEEVSGAGVEDLAQAIQTAFEIEHSGWKGEEGTSLLSHPRIADYYQRNFLAAAREGFTRLYFLTVSGQRIAFDLGYLVNGVYSSIKVSYLPDFQKYSAGNLLNARLLERFSQSNEVKWIDCIGPATESTRRWTDQTYLSGCLTLSTGSLISNAEVSLFHTVAQWLGKNSLAVAGK